MKRTLKSSLAVILVLACLNAGCDFETPVQTLDTTPPSAVILFTAAPGSATGRIELRWNATGDDGMEGVAHRYEVKYSTSPITDANFDQAATYVQSWPPKSPGEQEAQEIMVPDPSPFYHVAIRALDEVENASLIAVAGSHPADFRDPPPPPLLADFTATPVSGTVPLRVNFTDTSTGGATSWSWDFDGDWIEDSTDRNPSYTYTQPGTYSVSLTVTGTQGTDTRFEQDLVTVTSLQGWTPLPCAPRGRYRHATVWTGTEMIVWGGHNGNQGGFLADGGRYDPATGIWKPLADSPLASRFMPSAVWTGAEMIVWGGMGGWGGPLRADGAAYDPSSDTWTALPSSPLTPRWGHSAVWTGTEMILWGGYDGAIAGCADGAAYNPSTRSWRLLSSSPLASRYDHTAVWTGSVVLVWGGSGYTDTGASYDPATDAWSTLPAPPITARYRHVSVWTGTEMIVWGGRGTGGYANDGARYDPSTSTWSPLPSCSLCGRDLLAAAWTGTEMVVWGGVWGPVCADGARYAPSSDTWTVMASSSLRPRWAHSLVWTGTEIVIWGGQDNGGNMRTNLNTGGHYDPATDTWAPFGGGPGSRYDHTAVWTGAEMIVWGGYGAASLLDDGARYDPVARSWSTTSMPVTLSRMGHGAVWTGAEMIVWGGMKAVFGGGLTTADDGSRYSTAGDDWTPVSNAPLSGRWYHSTVWTGSEMIVWGGWDYGANLLVNDGARFDPVTASWIMMNGAGAPSYRYGHTAVWTGTEMLLWGGCGAADQADGFRYDPSTDTWSPLPATPLAGRALHKAVWTGTEVVIWGGREIYGTGYFADGARFNPFTNGWTSLPQSNLSGRDGHSAVWTGSRLVVWGGNDGTQCLGDGGIWDAASDMWIPTPASLLCPRDSHTAVWTGTEMIVFGGRGGANGPWYFDGARFGP
ncbi:MAG: Kelch repeat-containing protein [Planctomycetota bacterium]|jgi:PKD repeat protein